MRPVYGAILLVSIAVGAVGAAEPGPHVVGVQHGHVRHVLEVGSVHLDVVPGAQNLAEASPSAPVFWFFHTHPTIEERIAAAREFDAA